MKVLAIGAGRKNGNCEILLKEALMGVQETCGADVGLIRLQELTIKPCTGCESCMKSMLTGGDGRCVLKGDHVAHVIENLSDADGFILGAPAYELAPPGILPTLSNRMLGSGMKYHQAAMKKPKVGAVITLGGTDWTNLVLPLTFNAFMMLTAGSYRLVDQMLVQFAPAIGQVVLKDKALARAREIGRKVGEAMKLPFDQVKYQGTAEETCPVCHQNLLQIRGKLVVCPLCEIEGTISMDGGRLKVSYTDEWIKKDRRGEWGRRVHNENVAKGHKETAEHMEEIKEKRKKYNDYKIALPVPPLPAK